MKITIASVAKRGRSKGQGVDSLVNDYVERASKYTPTDVVVFENEAALLAQLARRPGVAKGYLVLLDSSGQTVSSEEFAGFLERQQNDGIQRIVFAIGPADGWTQAARTQAQTVFAFGRITLPHELARVVLAEQVYRALTILAGHPYHSGH